MYDLCMHTVWFLTTQACILLGRYREENGEPDEDTNDEYYSSANIAR